MLVLFQEHQISAGQLSADSSSTGALYCLNRNMIFNQYISARIFLGLFTKNKPINQFIKSILKSLVILAI